MAQALPRGAALESRARLAQVCSCWWRGPRAAAWASETPTPNETDLNSLGGM